MSQEVWRWKRAPMGKKTCLTQIMPTPIRHFGREVVAEGVNAMGKRVRTAPPASWRRDLEKKKGLGKEVVAGGHLSGLESGDWKGCCRK